MISNYPWSEWNREWVGMDVNMDEGEASSMPDTAEVSEGEGIYQNADEQEDENSRSMNPDFEEDTGIEQQLAGGEKLKPDNSVMQNPLENIDEEILVPDNETREMGENLLDPELAHVIVDEEVDFDQFGAPPPDLPVVDDLDNKQPDGIGRPNGEKGASGSTEVMKPEDEITDLDADTGLEQGMKNLNDEASLKDTEEKEQLQIEGNPEPDADPKPADNDESDVHRDFNTEPTAGRNGTSELREPETVNPENVDDASSESAPRSLNTKTEEEGSSAQEEFQKRTEDLNQLTQEQAKELEGIRRQVDLSYAQLEEQSEMYEELKLKFEAECDERLKSEAKLMVLHEILPNMEEKLKNLSDQVQFLEVQLQEQANSRNKLENDVQQEREEKTQYVTQLEEQIRLHEELSKTLDEERDGRLKSEADLMVLREMFTNAEEKMKDLRDQADSLVVQLQEETELKNSLEEKTKDLRDQVDSLVVQLEEETELKNSLEEKTKDLRDQVDSLVVQLEEETELKNSLEEKTKDLRDQVDSLVVQLEEETELKNSLEEKTKDLLDQVDSLVVQLEEETELKNSLEEKMKDLRDQVDSLVVQLEEETELKNSLEEKMKDLRDQFDSLVVQLQEETELRNSLEEKLDWERKERMQHMTKIEDQSKMHEELSLKIEEERGERLKSETHLKELRGSLSNKEEKLKDLHNQVVSLTAQLQEQKELKKELEGKWDHERTQDIATLPVSSMPWSEEKLEFEKLLDEQKTLLANQVQEAEKLKNAAEMRVGLLNHQVQNLEVLSDIAETMEHVFSAKEQVVRQAMWTVFQALCLGVGLISFVVAYRDPLRSSLQPT